MARDHWLTAGSTRWTVRSTARWMVVALASVGAVAATVVPIADAGRPATSLTWSVNPLAFGEVPVGGIENREIVLTNTGTRTLRRVDVIISGTDFFPGGESCSLLVLRPGDSCIVNVIFAPLVEGAASGTIGTTAFKVTFAAGLVGSGIPVMSTPSTTGGATTGGATTGGVTTGGATTVVGESHACARSVAGDVTCWGRNDVGQLGSDAGLDSTTPVRVALPAGVTSITAGLTHTCALTMAGEVWCWGGNDVGQVGDLSIGGHSPPRLVTGLEGIVTRLAAADRTTCALFDDGRSTCWGNGYSGRLVTGPTQPRAVIVLDLS